MSENDTNDDDLLENIIMKFLYTDVQVREKILPYLKFSLFDEIENVQLMKFIQKFLERYNKFPSLKESKLKLKSVDIFNHLKDIIRIDTTEYTTEVILGEIEEYVKQKAIMDVCFSVAEQVTNEEMDEIGNAPDSMREALAFSFDTKVGLDIFAEEFEEDMYNHFHNRDYVVSTGLETFDELIDGGFHEKALTLFLAECVTKDTNVRIRIRKKK